jgi:DNA polymerase beta
MTQVIKIPPIPKPILVPPHLQRMPKIAIPPLPPLPPLPPPPPPPPPPPQQQPPISSRNQLLIDVLSQLIEHTKRKFDLLVGSDKQRHQFRLNTFKKALNSVKSCPIEITSGTQAQTLEGIGKGIGQRIDEILRTHTLAELRQEIIVDAKTQSIHNLMSVSGIGEATASRMIEVGINSVDQLRERVNGGYRVIRHVQLGLKYYEDFKQPIPHAEIDQMSGVIRETLLQIDPLLIMEICGSYRRQKPFSGDIDVLISHPQIKTDDDQIKSNRPHLKEIVQRLKGVGFIIDDLSSQGDTKYMGVCHLPNHQARHLDLRFVCYNSYYTALSHATGSKAVNQMMRQTAIKKGLLLNEYGLFRQNQLIPTHSEKELYDHLGLTYLEPHQRNLD